MQSNSVKGAKLIRLYDISIHENALAITKAFVLKLFMSLFHFHTSSHIYIHALFMHIFNNVNCFC